MKWTKEKNDEFLMLYPDHDRKWLADHFGVTWSAIMNRAHYLGVRKAPHHKNKGCFPKNNRPWNKGMKGLQTGGVKYHFKPGHLPHNTKWNGYITTRKDGPGRKIKYIRIAKGRWKRLNIHVWELHHGKIPPNHIVIFKNGNSMNYDINNLKLISRSQNAIRNANRPKQKNTMLKIWRSEKIRYYYGLSRRTRLQIIRKNYSHITPILKPNKYT